MVSVPTDFSRIDTRTAIGDDEPFGNSGRPGRGIAIRTPRGPLITLVTRFVWRFGLFCLLTSPVWALPSVALPQAEGLVQPWVQNQATNWALVMFLSSLGGGLALILLGAYPGLLVTLGVLMSITGIGLAVPLAWLIADLWLRKRNVDPDHVYLGLGAGGNRRIGVALVLLAGLWVAAMRVGLPYRFHIPVGVDVAVFGAMPLVWLGVLGLAWDGLPTLKPRRRGDSVEAMLAQIRSAPPRKLAQPSVVEPAQLSDLVLPERTLSQVRALVRIIAEPDAARAAGIEAPVGAILVGPPGTGKTLVARAIAGECGRQALAFSGASLSSKWIGESTERISDMFRQARATAPCVLILDELDGIAPARQGDPSNSAAQRDFAQRINEILQQLEGVGGSLAGVFVIGATNHLDAIDPAVRSRLSQHISIPCRTKPTGPRSCGAISRSTLRSRRRRLRT